MSLRNMGTRVPVLPARLEVRLAWVLGTPLTGPAEVRQALAGGTGETTVPRREEVGHLRVDHPGVAMEVRQAVVAVAPLGLHMVVEGAVVPLGHHFLLRTCHLLGAVVGPRRRARMGGLRVEELIHHRTLPLDPRGAEMPMEISAGSSQRC